MTRLPIRSGVAWPATSEHPGSPMDRFFGGILRRLSEAPEGCDAAEFCPIDVDEDETNLYVDVELPGFSKDEVDIRIDREVVTITAERVADEPRGTRHLGERSVRRARRTLTLPATVNPEKAEATLRDGIAHLTLPKTGQQKGHKIVLR